MKLTCCSPLPPAKKGPLLSALCSLVERWRCHVVSWWSYTYTTYTHIHISIYTYIIYTRVHKNTYTCSQAHVLRGDGGGVHALVLLRLPPAGRDVQCLHHLLWRASTTATTTTIIIVSISTGKVMAGVSIISYMGSSSGHSQYKSSPPPPPQPLRLPS